MCESFTLPSEVSTEMWECGQVLHTVLHTTAQARSGKGLWPGESSCIMQTLSHLHQWNWAGGRGGGGCAPAWVSKKKHLAEKQVTSWLPKGSRMMQLWTFSRCHGSVLDQLWNKHALGCQHSYQHPCVHSTLAGRRYHVRPVTGSASPPGAALLALPTDATITHVQQINRP